MLEAFMSMNKKRLLRSMLVVFSGLTVAMTKGEVACAEESSYQVVEHPMGKVPSRLHGKATYYEMKSDTVFKSKEKTGLRGEPTVTYGFVAKGHAQEPLAMIHKIASTFNFSDAVSKFNAVSTGMAIPAPYNYVEFGLAIEPRDWNSSVNVAQFKAWVAQHRYHVIDGVDFELVPVTGILSHRRLCYGIMTNDDAANAHCENYIDTNMTDLWELRSYAAYNSINAALAQTLDSYRAFAIANSIDGLHRAVLNLGVMSRPEYENYYRSGEFSLANTMIYTFEFAIQLESGKSFQTFTEDRAVDCRTFSGAKNCGLPSK
jgi:hypothetical protein